MRSGWVGNDILNSLRFQQITVPPTTARCGKTHHRDKRAAQTGAALLKSDAALIALLKPFRFRTFNLGK